MSASLRENALLGRPCPFPIFDIHAHVGQFSGITGPSHSCIVAEMDRLGVAGMVVSSVEAIYGDVARGNDEAAKACEMFPNRFWAYAHVTAQQPALLGRELERCFRNPCFKGIKVYQVGVDYDSPAFDEVWAFAQERRLPILAHTWGGNLTGFDRAAERFPNANFIAGHAGSDGSWPIYAAAAKRLPNLYLDLTYSREEAGLMENLVGAVGAEKVVWGSDSQCFSLSHQAGKIMLARLDDAAKKTILHDNPVRLFGFGQKTA